MNEVLHLSELQPVVGQQFVFQGVGIRYFPRDQYFFAEAIDQVVPADNEQVFDEIVELGQFFPVLPEFEENILGRFFCLFYCFQVGEGMIKDKIMVLSDELAERGLVPG